MSEYDNVADAFAEHDALTCEDDYCQVCMEESEDLDELQESGDE